MKESNRRVTGEDVYVRKLIQNICQLRQVTVGQEHRARYRGGAGLASTKLGNQRMSAPVRCSSTIIELHQVASCKNSGPLMK